MLVWRISNQGLFSSYDWARPQPLREDITYVLIGWELNPAMKRKQALALTLLSYPQLPGIQFIWTEGDIIVIIQ